MLNFEYNFLAELNVSFACPSTLARYTTFQLGGPAPCVITCESPDALQQTVHALTTRELNYLLIGQGSNLLVSDQGVPVPVIRYVSEIPCIEREQNDLLVAACTLIDEVALTAAEEGLAGLNFSSGIPGTLGGAIVGNAGAFGKQIGDVLHSVQVLSPAGETYEVLAKDLGFSYRHSRLKNSREIVVSARLRLTPGERKRLLNERADILDLRRTKHPDYKEIPTAGSFFRNIEPTSAAQRRQAAGWFLEQAGVKSLRCGGAGIFEKHANIIVKTGDSTAQDVYDLAQQMADAVRNKFGLELKREVVLVGQFLGEAEIGSNDTVALLK